MVPWVGLQFVIVVFPDHTHFLLGSFQSGKPLCQSSHFVLFHLILYLLVNNFLNYVGMGLLSRG